MPQHAVAITVLKGSDGKGEVLLIQRIVVPAILSVPAPPPGYTSAHRSANKSQVNVARGGPTNGNIREERATSNLESCCVNAI